MSQLISFDFSSNTIRTILIKNNPWFVAVDVCKVLGLTNSRQALKGLDDDEKGVSNSDTLGGKQKLNTVNESGLYALIFKSRKPIAKKFRKWVTNEVLPSIRQTGQYKTEVKPDQYAEEYISNAQYLELRHVVWGIENNFHFKNSGSYAIYRVLRKELHIESVTKMPARLFDPAMSRLVELRKQAETFKDHVHKLEQRFCKSDFKTQDFTKLEQYVARLASH